REGKPLQCAGQRGHPCPSASASWRGWKVRRSFQGSGRFGLISRRPKATCFESKSCSCLHRPPSSRRMSDQVRFPLETGSEEVTIQVFLSPGGSLFRGSVRFPPAGFEVGSQETRRGPHGGKKATGIRRTTPKGMPPFRERFPL